MQSKRNKGRPMKPVEFWLKSDPTKIYWLPSMKDACEMLRVATKREHMGHRSFYNTIVRTMYIPDAYCYDMFKFRYAEEAKDDAAGK